MSPPGDRLQQLHRALETALDSPTEENLAAVTDAIEECEPRDDKTATAADDFLLIHCKTLARTLTHQLGPAAPPVLRRYALGEEPTPDGGPPENAIVYECPICGAEVESAPGLRAKCNRGHAPAYMVAAVRDDE